ncbi:MAG: nucleotidyltransferase family protein [Wujia sp.]
METFRDSGIKMNVIEEIRNIAKDCEVEKVYLFGSRARGDYKSRSDIDLAFCGGDANDFIFRIDDETATLLQFDIVDLNRPVQKQLQESIWKEGILIYEKV